MDKKQLKKDISFLAHAILSDYISSFETNEDDLKAMLVEHGPVVTSIDADGWRDVKVEGQSDRSEIFEDPDCCDAKEEGPTCR